jgi:hypothetical protein
LIAFIRAHKMALRTVFLLAVLFYIGYIGTWAAFKAAVPRAPGTVFLFASLPWSAPWFAFVPRGSVVSPSAHTALTVLLVGLGFGLNVTIVTVLGWYAIARRKARRQ